MSMSVADPAPELYLKYRDLDAPLSVRLAAYAADHSERFPAYSKAVDDLVQRLNAAGGWRDAPGIGETMPTFLLPDTTGRLVDLQAAIADGPVAIMFHRGHWCPYCRLNLHAVGGKGDEISALGGRVVIVAPERQEFLEILQAEARGRFTMLSDIDNAYAMSLNLAIWLGPDIMRIVARSGIDLPDYHGNERWMVPIPATFVVGRDGLISARFIDPDFRRRMQLDDLLTALRQAL